MGKDWKFLLRKSKSNTVFNTWYLYLQVTLETLFYQLHIFFRLQHYGITLYFRVYLGFCSWVFFVYLFLFCLYTKENILLRKIWCSHSRNKMNWFSVPWGKYLLLKIWMISTISYWTDRKISCPSTIWQGIDQVTPGRLYIFKDNKKVYFLLLCIQNISSPGVAHCRSLNQIK